MRQPVVIIYNEPEKGRYYTLGESRAEAGVLDEVAAVRSALSELGYPVSLLPLFPPPEEASRRIKGIGSGIIFNLFEGFDYDPASEAFVAFEIENTGLPYTGCSGSAIALAQDKVNILTLLRKSGVPVPEFQLISPESLQDFNLRFPCIVKPAGEHASHGLSAESVVNDATLLEKQVMRVSSFYGGKALVEEFIDGREFNAAVMGNRRLTVLPPSEIMYTLPSGVPRILTFDAKWMEESHYFKGTKASCPALLTPREKEEIARISRRVFRVTGCCGYARVDMRQDKDGRLKVIDVNPNPDISPGAGAFLQAKASGMTYVEFIEKILLLAISGE